MLERILLWTGIGAAAVFICDCVVARLFAQKPNEEELSPDERHLQDKISELEKLELEYEIFQELGRSDEDLKDLAHKITVVRNEVDQSEERFGSIQT